MRERVQFARDFNIWPPLVATEDIDSSQVSFVVVMLVDEEEEAEEDQLFFGLDLRLERTGGTRARNEPRLSTLTRLLQFWLLSSVSPEWI